jgi:hypothetical protein
MQRYFACLNIQNSFRVTQPCKQGWSKREAGHVPQSRSKFKSAMRCSAYQLYVVIDQWSINIMRFEVSTVMEGTYVSLAYGATVRIGPWPPFSGLFNLIRHIFGLLWRVSSSSQRPLPTQDSTINKHKIQTSMTPAGLEPAIPATKWPRPTP